MMKRVIFGLSAALGLALAGPADAQAPQPDAAVETADPALWRVADADTEITLLGTFHILPPHLVWRGDALNAAFNEADVVYFEVETDTPDANSKTLNVLMTQGFNKDGGTLSEIIAGDLVAPLKEIVASVGLPFDGVNPMRPWNAFLTISVQFIVAQGFEPGSGVDTVLLKEARTKGKEIRFFETIDQQLALFTGLAPATEKKLLEYTIRHWDEQAQSFDGLFAAWKAGDTATIDHLMNDEMQAEAPAVFEKLVTARNRAWAEELDHVLKTETGKVFVAVGAAHLVGGETSVPALLKAKGYDVSLYGDEGRAPDAANDNAAPTQEDEIGALLDKMDD